MQEEVWKDIPGYEGYYQVSNHGRVRSMDRVVGGKCGSTRFKKMRILKLSLSNRGYLGCNLFINNISLTHCVHQLVAMAFLNHKPDGLNLVVDHINNIRTDNRLENLQLVSHRHNSTKDRKGTSKYPGVSWRSDTKKWRARIRIGKQEIQLGHFTNESDAALAYQKALKDLA